MHRLAAAAVGLVGGAGAVVGTAIGWVLWASMAELECTGAFETTRCTYGARFLGGLWTSAAEFVGVFSLLGAVIGLTVTAIAKRLDPT